MIRKLVRPTALELEERVRTIADLKAQAAQLSETISSLQGQIIDQMDEMGEKTVRVKAADGTTIIATRTQSARYAIDEKSLQSKLGAALWKKVTTRILDRKKLDAFVASGEIEPLVVAECTTESHNAPYIKITRK